MTKVEMYTTGTCPYSIAAKKLLEKKVFPFRNFVLKMILTGQPKQNKEAGGGKQYLRYL